MSYAVETLSAQPILGIRAQTRVSEIGDTIGRLLPLLMAVAGDAVMGPVVARYHAWEEYASDCHVTPAAELRTRTLCPLKDGHGDCRGSSDLR